MTTLSAPTGSAAAARDVLVFLVPEQAAALCCRPPRFTGYCRRHRPSFLIAVLGDGGR